MNLNNKPFIQKLLLVLGLILLYLPLNSNYWGFYAHKKINEMAIYLLPSELRDFYSKYRIELIQYAVLPDQRRYILDKEAQRHYMDLDYYLNHPLIKNDSIEISEIIHFISDHELADHGTAIWSLEILYKDLIRAMKEKKSVEIIKKSAELGHYLGDIHVPLHTTSNYDGQKTNQVGIHSLWESKIPELLGDDLLNFVGRPIYLKNFRDSSWKWIFNSHFMVEEVLEKERKSKQIIDPRKQYVYRSKGNSLIKTESPLFINKYHESLDGMVEKQFLLSIQHVGDTWYSAWLEAGQPVLN